MPWVQESIWVKRNEHGVIVGTSEKLPDTNDFIPTVPMEEAIAGTMTSHESITGSGILAERIIGHSI